MFAGCSLCLPLIQGEQLMALLALSCQWSRARLCACSVGFFYVEEARPWSLPPLLSDSVWEGKVWCIGGDREAARTRSGVELVWGVFFSFLQIRGLPRIHCDHPGCSSPLFFIIIIILILVSTRRPAVIRTSRCTDSGPRRSAKRNHR